MPLREEVVTARISVEAAALLHGTLSNNEKAKAPRTEPAAGRGSQRPRCRTTWQERLWLRRLPQRRTHRRRKQRRGAARNERQHRQHRRSGLTPPGGALSKAVDNRTGLSSLTVDSARCLLRLCSPYADCTAGSEKGSPEPPPNGLWSPRLICTSAEQEKSLRSSEQEAAQLTHRQW